MIHAQSSAIRFLAQEARSLLTRLGMVKSFTLQTPMVVAAAVSPAAQTYLLGASQFVGNRSRLLGE